MMKENNCGFDVASKKEIEQVLNNGADPDSLIFANPCKLSSHLKYAAGIWDFIIFCVNHYTPITAGTTQIFATPCDRKSRANDDL